jgi:hypothetical protein
MCLCVYVSMCLCVYVSMCLYVVQVCQALHQNVFPVIERVFYDTMCSLRTIECVLYIHTSGLTEGCTQGSMYVCMYVENTFYHREHILSLTGGFTSLHIMLTSLHNMHLIHLLAQHAPHPPPCTTCTSCTSLHNMLAHRMCLLC